MSASSKIATQGFFRPADASLTPEKEPRLTPAGQDADSMFRAFVMTLLDSMQAHPKTNSDLLGAILTRHFTFFPEHRSSISGLLTAKERMQQLLQDVPQSKLINTMAYTLRQMAIDEILANPTAYRPAFSGVALGLTEQLMRQPGTPLHQCALIALATVLAMPLEILETNTGQDLHRRYQHNLRLEKTSTNPRLVVQKKEDQYFARVSHPELFNLKSHVLQNGSAVAQEGLSSQKLLHAVALIKKDDARLQKQYTTLVNRLATMLQAGEITKADLIDAYSRSIPTQDIASMHNLDSKYMQEKQIEPALSADSKTLDASVMPLVHALSKAMVLGYMQEEQVFNAIDSRHATDRLPNPV